VFTSNVRSTWSSDASSSVFPGHDAGVVDEHVDVAVVAERRRGGGGDGRAIAEVARVGRHAAAGGRQLLPRALEALRVDVPEDEPGAASAHLLREHPAEAARRARDEDRSVSQITHGCAV
jgi:hypothetical protein